MPRPLSEPEISDFRDRLCAAAAKLFASRGAEAVTMRSLAAELGVSPMTPYRYFRDKDDILAAVRARAFDSFAESLERAFAEPAGLRERGAHVADAYVRFAFENPDSYRLMFDLSQPGEENYPDLVRAGQRARRTMTAYAAALVEAGELAGDPTLIGHVFWAAIHGAVVLQLAGKLGPECDFARIRAATAEALFKGFRRA